MESLRIREKNILLSRIKEIEIYIDRNNKTIERFKKQNVTNFEIKQIKKLECANSEYLNELNTLKENIDNINNGLFDSKLIETLDKERVKIEKEENKSKKKYEKKI